MKNQTYDLVCIGMALVDSIIKGFDPEPVSASGFRAVSGSLNVGGEAVNEAIAASKLGMKTGILCALGNDDAGQIVKQALQHYGVETGLIRVSEQTPVTTMFVNEDGSRKSITNEAHKYNFHPEKYAAQFTNAKAVILGSLFRAPFDDSEIILEVLTHARNAGQLVFADTKLPNFRKLTLKDLRDSLPLVDYITPNEDEAKYFSGETEPEKMADVFLQYGVKNVIIKLGSKGCYLKNNREEYRLPAYNINAVDATGAGDNFAAAFASEILRNADNRDALCFANACGAICTTAVGAATALKNREQVLNWMEENR
ncbi:MAG: carbohydrate kinase family protein [Flexilinea sp.]|nr:carbohydrate kinase family protein [Flexilinea sp.]